MKVAKSMLLASSIIVGLPAAYAQVEKRESESVMPEENGVETKQQPMKRYNDEPRTANFAGAPDLQSLFLISPAQYAFSNVAGIAAVYGTSDGEYKRKDIGAKAAFDVNISGLRADYFPKLTKENLYVGISTSALDTKLDMKIDDGTGTTSKLTREGRELVFSAQAAVDLGDLSIGGKGKFYRNFEQSKDPDDATSEAAATQSYSILEFGLELKKEEMRFGLTVTPEKDDANAALTGIQEAGRMQFHGIFAMDPQNDLGITVAQVMTGGLEDSGSDDHLELSVLGRHRVSAQMALEGSLTHVPNHYDGGENIDTSNVQDIAFNFRLINQWSPTMLMGANLMYNVASGSAADTSVDFTTMGLMLDLVFSL